jgi:hypothetical protein
MPTRVFLIDFENVHNEGLTGIDSLPKSDEVLIFNSTLKAENLQTLQKAHKNTRYIPTVANGKNSLDFQLISYLGYLFGKAETDNKTKYIIISKDGGFDSAIEFWQSRGRKISRIENFAATIKENKSKSKQSGYKTCKISAAVNTEVEELIKKATCLGDFHGICVKKYKMPEGSKIYNFYKSECKEALKIKLAEKTPRLD